MDNFFEIGDLGIVRDIPAELAQLETANSALRSGLKKQKNITGILIVCLVGLVIYLAIKIPPGIQEEK